MKRGNSFALQLGFEIGAVGWRDTTRAGFNGSALRPGQQSETRSQLSPSPMVCRARGSPASPWGCW